MHATLQTDEARYRVRPTGDGHPTLPPIALYIETGNANFADCLTPDQARELGTALCALALKIEGGSVMDASSNLVEAADRFDAALGEGRR
jgi:hypothetical protein